VDFRVDDRYKGDKDTKEGLKVISAVQNED